MQNASSRISVIYYFGLFEIHATFSGLLLILLLPFRPPNSESFEWNYDQTTVYFALIVVNHSNRIVSYFQLATIVELGLVFFNFV